MGRSTPLSRAIARQNEPNSMGLKIPTDKGGRLVVHAVCAKYGFIQNSKLVFCSSTGNSTDYRNQMNSDVFKTRFIAMLNNLEEPSIIVMDNAPYHSTLVDSFPKSNARKSHVQDWLIKKKILHFHL